jgi:hypothetical protein
MALARDKYMIEIPLRGAQNIGPDVEGGLDVGGSVSRYLRGRASS